LSPGTQIVPVAIARVKQRYPGLRLGLEIDPSRQLTGSALYSYSKGVATWDWTQSFGFSSGNYSCTIVHN
jgi:hypothetical protein